MAVTYHMPLEKECFDSIFWKIIILLFQYVIIYLGVGHAQML